MTASHCWPRNPIVPNDRDLPEEPPEGSRTFQGAGMKWKLWIRLLWARCIYRAWWASPWKMRRVARNHGLWAPSSEELRATSIPADRSSLPGAEKTALGLITACCLLPQHLALMASVCTPHQSRSDANQNLDKIKLKVGFFVWLFVCFLLLTATLNSSGVHCLYVTWLTQPDGTAHTGQTSLCLRAQTCCLGGSVTSHRAQHVTLLTQMD